MSSDDFQVSSPIQKFIERLQGKESLEVEFKSAQGGLPKAIWETISAFANTRGGWIILGIVQKGNDITIEGVKNAHEMLESFVNTLNNPTKINYRVCGIDDVSIEVLDGKEAIIIRVPAAPRKARPIHINQNPYQGTYIRRFTGDYHCSKPDVDRMMREASDIGADSTVLPQYNISDIDVGALARYRRFYQTLNPASLWNSYTDQEFLKAIYGIRRDREKNIEGITVAGLLLLGKPEALRDWRTRHLIDYRMYSQRSNIETRWDDRITWEGNLFGAFEAIYPRLIQGQPTPFRLEGGIRIDESFLQAALREALVNLLVHADYAEPQPSLIQRSPEGYFFRNPGSSRVSEIDLLTGDRSDPRNPELVRMFRYVGLAEEAGTGIPKIIQYWHKMGFKMPRIDAGTERYEFTLELRHAHLIAEEDREWLHSLGENWTEIEQLALVRARHEGSIDNITLRQMTGQHGADITRVLANLRSRGLLQMIGGGRGARYQITPSLVGVIINPEDFGQNPEGLSQNPEDLETNPEGLEIELWNLSQLARENHHLPTESLESLITQLCARKALSTRELSILLERNPDYIMQIVRKLISHDKISRIYPANHPHQKFATK